MGGLSPGSLFSTWWASFILVPLVVCFILYFFCQRIENLLHTLAVKISQRQIQIRVITNEEECKEACALIKQHCLNLNVLGFDCEWVSMGVSRPVSLLQLSTVHGLCCLFRVHLLGDLPEELQRILNNCDIIKVGVAPGDDAKNLARDYNVQVFGTLDLRHLYPTELGLGSMSRSVLGIELDKSPVIRSSNWEISELTERQKNYAANDAFVAIEIFKKWLLDNSKTRFGILRIPYSRLFNFDRKEDVCKLIGVPFHAKTTSPPKCNKKIVPEKDLSEVPILKNWEQIQSNQLNTTHITRKTPLYHNCFMHAPDGELLCSCDIRKAEWYLSKGLAEVLPGEPFSIKLLFEPAARANEKNGGRYYQLLKQNCCVVCGAKESYLKHNVVPREYRKHFPKAMKNHQSHDVVLMCISCHLLASNYANDLKRRLADYCNAPILTSKVSYCKVRQKIKNFAKALLKSGHEIPYQRKIFLENEIKNFFMVNEVTYYILQKALKMPTGSVNQDYESHGLRVTNFFSHKANGLIELEKIWRKHFLQTMKPQFLPALWSISHNHSRLMAMESEKQL